MKFEAAPSIYDGFGRCTSRASRRTYAQINRVATLEAAKAEFEASWEAWKAWARMEEVTRLEQRGGVAIAFMAAVLWIMLLIAAWEYLF